MAYKFNPFTGQFDDSPGLVTSTTPGLAPAGAGGVPGGSAGSIQIHNGEVNPGLDAVTGFEWDSVNDRLDIPGDINLDDGGAFTTILQCITPTADRTISFPDATGTIALVAGSSGQLLWNNAGANAGTPTLTYDGSILTSSGRFINSYNATASSPAKTFTGTWFTGGTATTTKPHFLIEPTGTTSTGWSTSGTALGINAPSGFTGSLLDLQINGTALFRLDYPGAPRLTMATGSAIFASNTLSVLGIELPNARNISFSGSLIGKVIWSDVALQRDQAGVVAITNGSTGTGYLKQTPVAVSALPAAATVGAGTRGFVSDSTVAASGNFGATVAGGGSNNVPVFSDGTNWLIG